MPPCNENPFSIGPGNEPSLFQPADKVTVISADLCDRYDPAASAVSQPGKHSHSLTARPGFYQGEPDLPIRARVDHLPAALALPDRGGFNPEACQQGQNQIARG